MKRTQVSTTSMGIAAMRAMESEKPAGERICYDPFARKLTSPGFYLLAKLFSGYGEGRAPGAQGFMVCRCRYIDDYLQACLSSGIAQVVILGAGLDSRAYQNSPLRDVKTFEVDHPATQADKMKRVIKLFGALPENVTYVPIDFNEETLDKLLEHGFITTLKTLFIWEGVTYYLNPEAVDATLEWVKTHSAPGSAIIFDYIYEEALTSRHKRGEVARMQRYSRFTGEGLVFGIQKGQIGEFLTKRGFGHIVDADSKQFESLYCTGANQGRKVAEIYAIVHAEVQSV